jgi:hypothetical protein
MESREEIIFKIVGFLNEIGVPTRFETLTLPTFLPGILIDHGALVIDRAGLLYPGDLLHEAGHLAVMTAAERRTVYGDTVGDMGAEIGAQCWSYAAATYIGLDPAIVFHPAGYKGASTWLLQNFAEGRYIGTPLIQWYGLAYEPKQAEEAGVDPYPHMIRWLRE